MPLFVKSESSWKLLLLSCGLMLFINCLSTFRLFISVFASAREKYFSSFVKSEVSGYVGMIK